MSEMGILERVCFPNLPALEQLGAGRLSKEQKVDATAEVLAIFEIF